MSATPTDPSSTTSSTPELNTPLRTPPNPAQRSSSAESPATAIESNTAERRREEQLSKSDKQPIYVRGVLVPRTPDAPGAEDCCMSGCARCVYDLYKEDLEDYQETMAEVRKKLEEMKPPLSEAEWDVQLLGKRSGQEGGGKDDGAKEAEPIEIKGLDPTMKAFLEMERAMKKKQKV